jgi:hypothetical protein
LPHAEGDSVWWQVVDLEGREGGNTMATNVIFDYSATSVALVTFSAPKFMMPMHVKILLQVEFQPDGTYKYKTSSDGWSIVGEVPFSYVRNPSTISPSQSPLEGGVPVQIRLHSLPTYFPSNFTLVFGDSVSVCKMNPHACIDLHPSMISETVVSDWNGKQEISVATIQIPTRAREDIGSKFVHLKWTTLSESGTEISHNRFENIMLQYIHYPSLSSLSHNNISVEGQVVRTVIRDPTPIRTTNDLSISLIMKEDSIQPVSLNLVSIHDFQMVLDIEFPLSWNVGVVEVELSARQEFWPLEFQRGKMVVVFKVNYVRPAPIVLRLDPMQIIAKTETKISLYMKYLAPVSSVSELTVLVDEKRASQANVELQFSDAVYTSISVLAHAIDIGGIKTIIVSSPNSSSPATSTFSVRDNSILMSCVDGCDSKILEGHQSRLRIESSALTGILKKHVLLYVGGFQVNVTDLKSTSERGFDLTFWCPDYRVFLGNTMLPSRATIRTTNVKVIVEMQVTHDPTLIAMSDISYILPPEMTFAIFDPTGCRILVSFNMPTDLAQMGSTATECGDILLVYNSESILRSFGESSVCQWRDAKTLVVTPGDGSNILPMDKLRVTSTFATRLQDANKLALSHAFSDTFVSGITILPSSNPVLPTLALVGPQQIGMCGEAVIQGVATSCRPVTYSWVCDSDTEVQALLSNSSGLGKSFSSIRIPSSALNAGQPYTFFASVLDFQGFGSKVISHKLEKLEEPDIPVLSVVAGDPIFRTRPSSFRGQAEFSPCMVEKPLLHFTWQVCRGALHVEKSVFWKSTGLEMIIPAYVLNASETYVARLMAQRDGRSVAHLDFKFVTSASNLQAIIRGGGRTISKDDELVLDASMSNDPDKCLPGSQCLDNELEFSWTCKHGEEPCRYSSHRKLFSETGKVLSVTGTSLGLLGVVTFQLHISKQSRFVITETIITFLSTPTLTASIRIDTPVNKISTRGGMVVNCKERVILRGSVIESADVKWTWDSGGICGGGSSVQNSCIVDPSIPQLIIAPQVLQPGSKYVISLDFVSGAAVGRAELLLVINEPPVLGGTCKVEPLTGQALLQEFTVSCFGWSDADLPLTYEYGVERVFDDRQITALPPSQQVSASMRLSAGAQMIQVRAFDSFGAPSDRWVSSEISVSEMSISSLAGNSTLLSSDVEADAAARMDDLANSFIKVQNVAGFLMFSSSLGSALDAENVQSARRRTLLGSSATYRMRVRRSLLKKMGGASNFGGVNSNALVVQSVASLSKTPDELTPDSTEYVTKTIAAMKFTVAQAAGQPLNDFVKTTVFIMSTRNPAPEDIRESASLTSSRMIYEFGQTALLSLIVQDPPRTVPSLGSWVLYMDRGSCTSDGLRDVQTSNGVNLTLTLSGHKGDEYGVMVVELPAYSLWQIGTLPPRTIAVSKVVGYRAANFSGSSQNMMTRIGRRGEDELRRATRVPSLFSSLTVVLPLDISKLSQQHLQSLVYYNIDCVYWDPTSDVQNAWRKDVCVRVNMPVLPLDLNGKVSYTACQCSAEGYVTAVFTYRPLPKPSYAPVMQLEKQISVSSEAINFLLFWQVSIQPRRVIAYKLKSVI